MTRYKYKVMNNTETVPVILAIPMQSWNPYHETEFVKLPNGNPVRTNHIIHDYRASVCLRNLLTKRIKQVNPEQPEQEYILITCDDIKFDCMSEKAKKPTENKIQTCLKRMQAGKCPYNKIAGYLFTNLPPKKHR
jgi:hypothetical protein